MYHGEWHADGTGVYGFAKPPVEIFTAGDGYVLLELKVVPYLKKATERKGKYVLKGPPNCVNTPCFICEVLAMHAPRGSVPAAMYWALM